MGGSLQNIAVQSLRHMMQFFVLDRMRGALLVYVLAKLLEMLRASVPANMLNFGDRFDAIFAARFAARVICQVKIRYINQHAYNMLMSKVLTILQIDRKSDYFLSL